MTVPKSIDSALDVLAHDADVGEHDLVAVLQLVAAGGLGLVALLHLDAQLVEGVLDGERGDGALGPLVGPELHLQRLGGDDLEVDAVAADVTATAGRQVGAEEAVPDLAEGVGHLRGGHPVAVGVAVDLEVEGAAEVDGDPASVGHLLVQAGGDDVVRADVDALGVEDVTDGPAHGGDLLGLPVEGEGHRLAESGVSHGGTGNGKHDHGRQGDHQGAAAGEPPGQGCELGVLIAGHDSPNVVLPGSRVPARSTRTRATCGWRRTNGGQTRGHHCCGAAPALVRSIPIPAISHWTLPTGPGDANSRTPELGRT